MTTTQTTAVLNALEAIRAEIGLERLRVEIEAQPDYYPEARGREVADLICRIIAQHLGIEHVEHAPLETCSAAVAARYGDTITARMVVFYREGGA